MLPSCGQISYYIPAHRELPNQLTSTAVLCWAGEEITTQYWLRLIKAYQLQIFCLFVYRDTCVRVSSTLVWSVNRAVMHRHSGLTQEGTSTPSCHRGPPPLPCLSCPCSLQVYRTEKRLLTYTYIDAKLISPHGHLDKQPHSESIAECCNFA